MTLTQLRSFLAIASAGTMSAAARQIGTAQPALSLQLAKLEEELGQPLFLRHGRGMTLTEAGQRLRGRAAEIMRHVDLARNELAGNAESPVGTVALGMATAANMAVSVELLVEARRRFPAIKLHLVESMSGFLLEWVERGRIDMAVVYDVPSNAALTVEPLREEELYLIVGPDAPLRFEGRISFASLGELPLILPGIQHRLRELIQRKAAANGISLVTLADVDSTYTIKKLVSRGEGLSILSRHAVEEELARGELFAVPIEGPAIKRSIDLVSYPPRKFDRSVAAIRRLILERVAPASEADRS